MPPFEVNLDLLRQFELELDPRHPENSRIPTKVLGYGEISTVLELGEGQDSLYAYKRMSMLESQSEVESYVALHDEYVQVLEERVGINVVQCEVVHIPDIPGGKEIVYIVQEKLPVEGIINKLLHQIQPQDVIKLIQVVLKETAKVYEFNQKHKGTLEVAIDGQISNWAILNFDPHKMDFDDQLEFAYFDTSTPFIRRDGVEQLDPELFLRSAPSFLTWILRLFFLEDVMNRYYDFRKVTVDLIANFYKEQLPELVPELIEVVNQFFADQIRGGDIEPFTEQEIKAYYREDAMIWKLYLTFRRVDRSLHKLLGKDYAYILPGKIKR